jgi:methionine-rich copper-binding protein CopC
MPRSLRSLALLLTLALAAPLSAAHAHPRLVKATPAADSRSADAPRQVALTFNESLDLALTRVTLLHNGSTIRSDSLRLADGDDKTVIVSLGTALAPGRYTVRWQVTGDDGHPVRGEFSFEVLAGGGATHNHSTTRLAQ